MTTTLGPTDEQIRIMRRNVMTRIIAAEPVVAAPRAMKPTARRRVAFATVGVAAAAAVVLGSVLLPGRNDSSAAAATLLTSAASLTIATSDVVAGAGQYLRIETLASYGVVGENSNGAKVSWLAPESTVLYDPSDPDAQAVMERHQLMPTVFFGDGAEAVALQDWEFSQSDPLTNGTFPVKESSTDSLPRDPQRLYELIRGEYDGGSNSADEDAWVRITALLRTGTAPADLRSALYSAAAMIPGIEVVPGAASLNGRTGIAIGRTESSRDERQDIIIDEHTGEFIGERTVRTTNKFGAPAGTAWAATSVTTTVVDAKP